MAAFFPISELSSYQSGWTIRARVTAKSQMRTFGKDKQGKVFSVDLLDDKGGEIRASFFGLAADQFSERLQQGKCFTFSKGSLRVANRQYNTCNHRYEIVFEKDSTIEEADDAGIETLKFNFVNLKAVQAKPMPCTVDLCGVVTSFKAVLAFTSKDGKELVKREIVLADDSATSMSVTLWGERAQQKDSCFADNAVVCLKGVVVKEWQGGRSGSLLGGGALVLDGKFPEVDRVKQWWSQGGATQSLAALSQDGPILGRAIQGKPGTLADVRRAAEGLVSEQETFSVVCRLALVQTKKQGETQPLLYMACQEPKEGNNLPCNKRVDESGFCAACNRAGKIAPRLNLRCRFADCSDNAWLTTFHDGAEKVLDMKAEDMHAMEKGEGGREALEAAIRSKYFNMPIQISVRAKQDSYNGEPRTNVTCTNARPVQHGEHGRALLKEINLLLSQAPESALVGGA